MALALLLGLAMTPAGFHARAQSTAPMKAAFLYNFAKFAEWPAGAFSGASAKLVVGFVGGGNLADTFEKNVVGKNANGREFEVKKLGDPAEAAGCQIVMCADAAQAAAVVGAAKGKPVLTIGDGSGFGSAGGMISFIEDGGKIAFELNLGAVKDAGFKLDPKLEKLAKSVKN